MQVFCPLCHSSGEFDPHQFRCACGGAWEPEHDDMFDDSLIIEDRASIWRYQKIFNQQELSAYLPLGAGWTPLIETDWEGKPVRFKLEFIAPTGSFKDRGTEVEMNVLKALGVNDVVEDSSGNAGSSMAAYSARLGLNATIFSPSSASPAKLAQIEMYGAKLERIPGPRYKSTEAVLEAVSNGAVYASHAYNPAYLLGQLAFAWEMWEQLGKSVPDAVVVPTGQGGLMMGAWLGFQRLHRAGIIKRMPRIYAVQAEIVSPIHQAFKDGLDYVPEYTHAGRGIAEGLATVKPVRGRRILEGIRETNGTTVAVSEVDIRAAYFALAKKGFYVEPTSAVAAAALPQVFEKEETGAVIVAALTGSGLKSPLKD
jgi:threonine synthase